MAVTVAKRFRKTVMVALPVVALAATVKMVDMEEAAEVVAEVIIGNKTAINLRTVNSKRKFYVI